MPSTLFCLQTLALASLAAALPNKKRDSDTLHLDVVKSRAVVGNTVDAPFTVSGTLTYFVKIGLGTPEQTIYSQLDTGSSNLVVYPPNLQPQGANCQFSTEICSNTACKSMIDSISVMVSDV